MTGIATRQTQSSVYTLSRLVVPLSIKAAPDVQERTFEGLAAVFEQDLGNDIISKGAFKKTLAEWKKSSDALPLLNSHNHFDIFSAIGQLLEAKETKDGLWTKWEVLAGPEGDAVMSRLTPSARTGRPVIGKMSIGFEATKFSFEQPPGTESFFDRIRHLEEIALKEVSLVLFPMAPGAAIDASTVKSFYALAQATDPKKVDSITKQELRKLASRIGSLLKKQDPTPNDDESDAAEDEAPQNTDTDTSDESPPPPAPVAEADATDDTDNTDDTDDSEVDVEDEMVAEVVTESGTAKSDEPPAIYTHAEALKHKLAALKLKQTRIELADRAS